MQIKGRQIWVVGTLIILSAVFGTAFTLYYDYFGFFKPNKSIKDDPNKVKDVVFENESDDEEDEDEDEEEEEAVKAKTTKAGAATAVTVEDESDSDDDEAEEEDEETAEIKKASAEKEEAYLLLKGKYEEAMRIAPKLIAGQAFERAADKLTECIELATQINVREKDVVTLYNNRSAMYEKLGEFEKGLCDIRTVLVMEPHHTKARTRRARIYEAQGEHTLALRDYTYVMTLERIKGEQPTNEKKVEDLSKVIAAKHSVNVLSAIRNSQDRPIPSKSYNFLYCRNFMETFPNIHRWKETYGREDRDELRAKVSSAGSAAERVGATLKLVFHDLASESYSTAFKTFATIESDFETHTKGEDGVASAGGATTEMIPSELLSQCWELKGTELHLRCYLSGALEAYQQAVRWDERNIEVKLKLAGVLMELGEHDKAAKIYDGLLTLLAVPSSLLDANVVSDSSNASSPVIVPTSSHSRSNSETERGDGTPQRQASPEPEAVVSDEKVAKEAEVAEPEQIGAVSINGVTVRDGGDDGAVRVEDVDEDDAEDVEFVDAKSQAPTPMKSGVAEPVETSSSSITMDQSAFLSQSALLPPREEDNHAKNTGEAVASSELVASAWLSPEQIISYRAWTLIHRANTWIARDDQLQFMPNAVSKSLADVDAALKLTESVMDLPEGRAARFIALLKSVHVLTQTKQMVGEAPSPEDAERNKNSVTAAGKIFPAHESRMLLEADLLSAEGETERALALIEQAGRGTLKGDVTPLVMKASVLCTKVLMDMQLGPQPTSQYEADMMRAATMEQFNRVEVFYTEALDKEPDSIEVLAQYAQFKTMVTGDFEGAVGMLKRAVPLSRSRDEAIELCQLLAANEAQFEANKDLQAMMMG